MKEFIRRNFFIFLFSVSYLFFKYFNIEIFPDLLHLSSIDSSDYFELIIGATTSVFGILIAIVLLTFEFLKNISFKRENENILNKSEVTNLISLALSVILLSFISYITIEDFKESNNITIAYYLGFLFIYFIFSIFPSAKEILGSANTLKSTLNEIENLSLE